MNILLALVPISLILLGLAIYAFVWAVRNGQYDDLDTPALDILVDRPPEARPESERAAASETSADEASAGAASTDDDDRHA
ncbi:MAG: cbb3-type cytochrome oxidase assembly protein CcoS [Lysobacter sp.]|nr:MAG: cbb3-type cytochrome oxidase assembly protein CcoS [Lysobacter sp.]